MWRTGPGASMFPAPFATSLVGSSCFLEINHITSRNAFYSFGFVLTRLPIYISLAANFFKANKYFQKKLKPWDLGYFQAKFL